MFKLISMCESVDVWVRSVGGVGVEEAIFGGV
jgi:hypothetical protein